MRGVERIGKKIFFSSNPAVKLSLRKNKGQSALNMKRRRTTIGLIHIRNIITKSVEVLENYNLMILNT